MSMNKWMVCKNPDCPRRERMTPSERPEHWIFNCPTCGAVQVWDKRRPEIGGTLGAGMRNPDHSRRKEL